MKHKISSGVVLLILTSSFISGCDSPSVSSSKKTDSNAKTIKTERLDYPLKVRDVGLGINSTLPCKVPQDFDSCDTGKYLLDQLNVEVASDKETVIRVVRNQYLMGGSDDPKAIVSNAVNFYGQPAVVEADNWLLVYGDAFTVHHYGQSAWVARNDSGIGLAIKGNLCGDGLGGTVKCDYPNAKYVIRYDLINVPAYIKANQEWEERNRQEKAERLKQMKY